MLLRAKVEWISYFITGIYQRTLCQSYYWSSYPPFHLLHILCVSNWSTFFCKHKYCIKSVSFLNKITIVSANIIKRRVFLLATYSLSFQRSGVMDDDSVKVYATLKSEMPSLTQFTVCTWIKFHFEVKTKVFMKSSFDKKVLS